MVAIIRCAARPSGPHGGQYSDVASLGSRDADAGNYCEKTGSEKNMLGFGTKKPLSLDRFPIENWIVAQAQTEDAPMILRINSGARKYIAHPELPVRLGVTVAFNAPNEYGFCTPEEGQQLSQIEDRLTEELMKNQIGFPVLVVTCGGKREFMAVFDPTSGKPALPYQISRSGDPFRFSSGLSFRA
jgi:hypothetical protein